MRGARGEHWGVGAGGGARSGARDVKKLDVRARNVYSNKFLGQSKEWGGELSETDKLDGCA